MSDIDVKIEGLDDLVETFDDFIKRYPDRAGELLRKNAYELRKKGRTKARSYTKTKGESKMSLGKLGSYKVSPVKGTFLGQHVEISAKSPHFHLVEHGHNLVDHQGNTIGYVEGKHYFADAVKEYNHEMPKTVEHMVGELLKEEGLT